MTSAEVKFLMAEATVKKWNVGSVSAEDLYKQGVRAAIDFLTDNYGCTATTDAEFDAFIQDKGAFGHTDNQKLEAINTQAWILHFTNPAECWANVRRSGYPKLKSPAEYGFGQYLTGGTKFRYVYAILYWNLPIIKRATMKPSSAWEEQTIGTAFCGGILKTNY